MANNAIERLINIFVNNKEANQALDQTTDKLKKLDQATTKVTQTTNNATEANKKNANSSKSHDAAVEKITNSYGKFAIKAEGARLAIEKFKAAGDTSSYGFRKATKDLELYTSKVDNLKKSLSTTNTADRLGSLIGGLGIFGGITAFIGLSKQLIEVNKEVEKLTLSMQYSTATAKDLERVNKELREGGREQITVQDNLLVNQGFLRDIAERYGLEIKSLTQQFIGFNAAAKESLSQSQIRDLFDGVAKASATMGFSVEQTGRAFLAFQQIASKGIVSMEELRRQLGDALPGAIQIATNAYNKLHVGQEVTLEQFQKMVGEGKVLATDILPAMGDSIQEFFNIQDIDRVKTLQSELNRLKNSWTELGVAIGQTGAIGFFSTLLDLLTDVAIQFRNIIVSWKTLQALDEQQGIGEGLENFSKGLQDVEDANTKRLVGLTKGTKEYDEALKENTKTLKEWAEWQLSTNDNLLKRDEQTAASFEASIKRTEARIQYLKDLGAVENSIKIQQAKDKLVDDNERLRAIRLDIGFRKAIVTQARELLVSLEAGTEVKKENAKATLTVDHAEQQYLKTLKELEKQLEKNIAAIDKYLNRDLGKFFKDGMMLVDVWYDSKDAVEAYTKAYKQLIAQQAAEEEEIKNSNIEADKKAEKLDDFRRKHKEQIEDLKKEKGFTDENLKLIEDTGKAFEKFYEEYAKYVYDLQDEVQIIDALYNLKVQMYGLEQDIYTVNSKGIIETNAGIDSQYAKLVALHELRVEELNLTKGVKSDESTKAFEEAKLRHDTAVKELEALKEKQKAGGDVTDKEISEAQIEEMALFGQMLELEKTAAKDLSDYKMGLLSEEYNFENELMAMNVENYNKSIEAKLQAEEEYRDKVSVINQNLQGFLSQLQDESLIHSNDVRNALLVVEKGLAIAGVVMDTMRANTELKTRAGEYTSKAIGATAEAALATARYDYVAAGLATAAAAGYTGAAAKSVAQIPLNWASAGIGIAGILATTLTSWNRGGGGGGGNAAGGSGGAAPQAQFNVVGSSNTNQLAAQIGASQNQPVKAFVVGKEVTTQQSLDQNRVKNATFI